MEIETQQYSLVQEKSLYGQYRQFKIGEMLRFPIYEPIYEPSYSRPIHTRDEEVIIAAIKGGGFFGRVLILKDKPFVLKTSVPDAWHDFWRRVNWGFRDFPSQVNEAQAKLDYLATNLIADVLPVVTNGRFVAPHSLGYTKLSNGYAQIVERMSGRPPRYDLGCDEFNQFRQAQQSLKRIGYSLGLEQAAQIHEDNPFGLANLWKSEENNNWIWLDTLPAIPHTGWVWPFFNFRFHQDVRNWFYPKETGPQPVTFNRIHTDRFLNYISEHEQKFPKGIYQCLLENIKLYDQLMIEKDSHLLPDRNFAGISLAAAESGLSFASAVKNKILESIIFSFKAMRDPNILALAGIEQAHRAGIITDEELENVSASVTADIPAARSLAVFYEGYGWLISKPMEWSTYAFLALNSEAASLPLAFAGFKSFNGLVRRSGTYLLGKLHGVESKDARRLSMLPYAGDYLGIVAQVRNGARNNGPIWHYTIRNMVANLSAIFPDGGWGSEREGRWWINGQKFVQRLQSWQKHLNC